MEKNLNKTDALILIVLFLFALRIWAIPSLSSPYFFGEGDAYWHYGQSDFIVESDHIDSKLPYSYINKYFLTSPMLGPLARQYPPSNHVNYANIILLGGHKFIPLGIFKAITSFLAFLGVYLLSRYLFSQKIAIIASFGVLFSNRVFSTFLFGQQPATISFVFIPLILYTYYRIVEQISNRGDFRKYLIILALLLASQFLLHLQGLYISVILLITISLLLLIKASLKRELKNLRLLFSKENLILYILLLIVILTVILPFFNIYFGEYISGGESTADYSRLFRWGRSAKEVAGGWPASFVSFKTEYSYLFLPFLLIGILFSLIKYKSNSYLFMIGSLAGAYLVFHSDLLVGMDIMRVAKMLAFESYIFWILISIGLSLAVSFVTTSVRSVLPVRKIYLRYFLILCIVILIYAKLGAPIKTSAENAYPPIMRVSSDELAAADWIKQNLPLQSHIFMKDEHIPWRYYKHRFIRTMAHRPVYYKSADNISKSISEWNEKYTNANEKYQTNLPLIRYTYLLINYGDYLKLAAADKNYQSIIDQFKKYEKDYFENIIPIYNRGNIVIYNITGMEIY